MGNFTAVEAHSAFSSEKMAKNNLFTTERLFCDVYCFEPGQSQKPHAHAHSDKIYYVLEGAGVFRVGAEERRAAAGTAVLAPAGAAHGVVNPGPERLRLLVVMAPLP